jgi:Ras-related protein Rab-18
MNNLDNNNRDSYYTRVSKSSNEVKTFYKFKLILGGDSGVGKTSLLNRYMEREFTQNQPCTVTADCQLKSLTIDSLTSAQLMIWDTCGQEKFRSMTNQYFKFAHGVILVYDVSDRRSFANLNSWLEDIKKNSMNDDISIILVGNKIDLEFRNITSEQGSKFAKDNNLLYCETSSKEGLNVESPFETLTKDIILKKNNKRNFENEINEKISLTSTCAVRGKERKREKDIKCC